MPALDIARTPRRLLGSVLFLVSCAAAPPGEPQRTVRTEGFAFSADRLLAHIRTLSSDAFEGRGLGSRGEALTVAYIEGAFREIGLAPGNPDGSYLQPVPLVGITPDPAMKFEIGDSRGRFVGRYRQDFVAWTKRIQKAVAIDAEVVFAGYGVQAPEFRWDDFKGFDVRGKLLLVLVNDPPVPGESSFGGEAMTYYGRWTYKFEKAAELGAAGCLIVHETARAGYPWEVVTGSWSGEQFDLAKQGDKLGRVAVEGWVEAGAAKALVSLAGRDLDALRAAAIRRDFRPVPLGVRARVSIQNKFRAVSSHNVVARLPGSAPRFASEQVVYLAHWDHFGIGPEVKGERIYHGAIDNASGVAGILEIARAFRSLPKLPSRSVLFLATTAEEQGLLGSRYYAEHPLYPLAKTAAVVNLDGLNVRGRTRDVVMIGRGTSTLDEVVDAAAAAQGRIVRGDPEPEKGYFYRSDHFHFAKQGVPAYDPEGGIDYLGRPAGWGMEMRKKYIAEDYHKPSDIVRHDWDLGGALEDLALHFDVGRRVADAAEIPVWKPGAEFKRRE